MGGGIGGPSNGAVWTRGVDGGRGGPGNGETWTVEGGWGEDDGPCHRETWIGCVGGVDGGRGRPCHGEIWTGCVCVCVCV